MVVRLRFGGESAANLAALWAAGRETGARIDTKRQDLGDGERGEDASGTETNLVVDTAVSDVASVNGFNVGVPAEAAQRSVTSTGVVSASALSSFVAADAQTVGAEPTVTFDAPVTVLVAPDNTIHAVDADDATGAQARFFAPPSASPSSSPTLLGYTGVNKTDLVHWFVYNPMHEIEQQIWVVSPVGSTAAGVINQVTGVYLIGNGADGTAAHPDGGNGGLLFGDGGLRAMTGLLTGLPVAMAAMPGCSAPVAPVALVVWVGTAATAVRAAGCGALEATVVPVAPHPAAGSLRVMVVTAGGRRV